MTITREIAPANFAAALALLTAHSVPISVDVTAAATELARVETLKPVYVTPQSLSAAYRDPAATAPALIILAAEVATHNTRSEAYRHAWTGAALAGLATIAAEAADIVEFLRPTAQAHLDKLQWYADAGSPDIATLVRQGNTVDAAKAAAAPLAFADFEALVKLRRDVSGKAFDWSKAGRYSNPELVADAMGNKALTGLEFLATAVRAGGILWWPTIEQAATVTARVLDAEDAAQRAEHDADRMQRQSAL